MTRRLLIAAAVLLGVTPAFAQNYQATQGSGTTFGSKLVSAVNYPMIVFCDPTTPSQCAVVDSSGIITIKVASGGLAVGAGTDGWDATQGAKADAVCGTDTGTCSIAALMKKVAANLTTLNTTAGAAIAAGTNVIGAVGADPSLGGATPTFGFLALPATTTTQIIALSGSTKTYVTSVMALAGGTVNLTFKFGTGSNCGTGTTTLAGPYPLTAQTGFSQGAGTGAVIIVPAGQALCLTTDASVSGGVHLTYQQK